MAGPIWKVDYIFNLQRWGWTESVYLNTTANISTVFGFVKSLGALRKGMLANDCTLEAARVTDIGDGTTVRFQKGLAPQLIPGTDFPGSYYGTISAGPDPCALATLYSQDGFTRRTVLLRGMPNSAWFWHPNDPTAQTFTAQWRAAFNAWFQQLVPENGFTPYAIKHVNRDGNTNPRIDVDAVDYQQSTGRFRLKFADGATDTISVGDRIHTYGAKGPGIKGLNGPAWVIQKETEGTGPDTKDILVINRRPKCPVEPTLLQAPAFIQQVSFTYPIIGQGVLERVVWRKTGRPFFGTLGKAKTTSC